MDTEHIARGNAGGQIVKWIYKVTYPNRRFTLAWILPGHSGISAPWTARGWKRTVRPSNGATLPIRRQILWESEDATDATVRQKEIEFIRELRSNDPAIGYSRWPKLKP
jgi:hypothetical protein